MIKKSLLAVILFFLFVCSADCESPEPLAENNYYYPVADAYVFNKQPPLTLTNLYLTAPAGQGPFVHNGNILTFKGSIPSHATLVSARLEDDQDRVIRDVSRRLEIELNTGDISGSTFVGSFRGAVYVQLNVIVQDPTGNQSVKGTSNTLFVDNSYPEVQIIEPVNHSYFKTVPIMIHGTAYDDLSGVASVEISIDGGLTYCNVDSLRNGQWKYSFTPTTPDTAYIIKARSTDIVGLKTASDNFTIHYSATPPAVKKIAKPNRNITAGYSHENKFKSPDDDGICTYRIISLKSNRFQATDLFTLKEEMAIIVKGYGGNMVTVRIFAPSSGKVVFELKDYIPANKHKMWKWQLSQTGTFQAAMFVDGIQKDDVFFKIIQ
ncbi:MAG: hypothetical protein HF978_16520 [Desulfobacteraceae bacterium]|nr:Ig-like domain-containing protein [Desulfobacteraceae bacterium]MBC2757148.1 hypothetical protein [Desulfobacteraceae bacterium]